MSMLIAAQLRGPTAALLTGLAAGATILLLVNGDLLEQASQRDNVFAATVILTLSVVALIAVLAFLVAILSWLGLTNPHAALGLPEGTIRAVIALILIILFLLSSLFLYETLRRIGMGTQTVFKDVANADVLRADALKASQDIAKQLVTTVATLVVAVAGFYFGAQSVAAAQGAVGRPSVRVVRPEGPISLAADQNEYEPISVETAPAGEALTWEIIGDPAGALEQVRPGEFRYRRGTGAQDLVLLRFALARDRSVTAEVRVVRAPVLLAAPG